MIANRLQFTAFRRASLIGLTAACALPILVAACSSSSGEDSSAASADASAAEDAATSDAAPGADAESGGEAGADAGDPVARLRAMTASCTQISAGLLALNAGDTPTVPICSLPGAVFWKADMDIDCDGKQTTQCNIGTDPDYQNQTAASDTMGNALDAANLPYVVVPGKSAKFDATAAGLAKGDVILVLYENQIGYAVYGDVGPSADIGEASYATAVELGIDPDPSSGGVDAPDVLYVAFTGTSAIVKPIENHDDAVTLGKAKLSALLGP